MVWDSNFGTELVSVDGDSIYVHVGITSTISTSFSSPSSTPDGLTYDGTNLISSSDIEAGTDSIYIHVGVTSTISTSFSSPGLAPAGLAYDGTNLISCDYGNLSIYVHVGITSTISTSFSTPLLDFPYGLTYDGANLISSCYWYDNIYVHPGIAPITETVKSPSTESGDWTNPTGAYTKDDGQYLNTATKNGAHTFGGYGFTEITGETPLKVEVGVEGYGDGDDYVEIEASWDGGTSWTTAVSHTPPTSEPSVPTYLDVTDGRSWTWSELGDANFRVRITKRTVAKGNTIYVDWLPVRVASGNCFSSPGTDPHGLAYDGTNLISLDHDTSSIYIHVGVTSTISTSFSTPGTSSYGCTLYSVEAPPPPPVKARITTWVDVGPHPRSRLMHHRSLRL